jgi:hypothetical protein
VKTEILFPPASLPDFNKFTRKLNQLLRRVINLEELEGYVYDSVEEFKKLYNKLEEKLRKLEDTKADLQ